MKKLIGCLGTCSLLFASQASFAWGEFSTWSVGPPTNTAGVCSIQRPRGVFRFGQASVFTFTNGSSSALVWAIAQNTTSSALDRKGFGTIDLWLQTTNARNLVTGPLQIVQERQGFGIRVGDSIGIMTETLLPIGPVAARCAAQ